MGDGLADLDRAVVDLADRGAVPIPPYPAVALRVAEAIRRPDFDLPAVARLVGSDAALAADVLRCASSAMFGRGGPVAHLAQAVARLGSEQLARIALSSALGAQVGAPGPLAVLRRVVWIESVAGAVICQELARLRQLPGEEAYLVGLLHDVGKVVATACLETLLRRDPAAPARPLAAWAELVERHHVRLGLLLAERWSLPPLVREVIRAHHGAPGAGADRALVEVVGACDRILRLLATIPHLSAASLAGVPELRSARERDAVAGIVEQIPEFVAAFEAPGARPGGPPSLVAQAPAPAADAGRPVAFPVTLEVARRQEYGATRLAPDLLVAVGRQAAPENRLLKATLRCGPAPLELWVLVQASRPGPGGVRVELRPYALSSEARARWDALR